MFRLSVVLAPSSPSNLCLPWGPFCPVAYQLFSVYSGHIRNVLDYSKQFRAIPHDLKTIELLRTNSEHFWLLRTITYYFGFVQEDMWQGPLVQQEDMSSCSRRSHVLSFNMKTRYYQQEDMSSCSTRKRVFLLNKKTCLLYYRQFYPGIYMYPGKLYPGNPFLPGQKHLPGSG